MHILKKILIPVLLLSSIFTIAGCGKKEDKKKTTDVVTHKEAKGKIGKDGGEVKDSENNVSLNIPKDALSKDTEITIRYISSEQEIDDNPNINFLGAVEYGPSGTVFDKEVEAKVKLTKVPTNSTVSVFCYDEVNKVWDYVTSATVKDGVATCKITHFSRYEYLDLSSAMKDKYESLVNQAISEGKSDEWITLTYYDYLVDECHVLDYYPNYEGYYYYGCGLKIFGNYQVDGKTGNSEDLSLVWGESNKVGNTYGYSKVGGSTSSTSEYKKNVEETIEKKSCSSVTVVIEYKMITPQFTMSASKTNLQSGETADVSLYCHYYNAANKLHQDFPLDDYYLELSSSSSNYTVDRTSVVTDNSGKATFKVTCNKSGEKAVIKATFDVSGDFGTHAEGMINFGSDETYNISGHIEEAYTLEYYVPIEGESLSKTSDGILDITIEYDFQGTISCKNGKLEGEITFNNITAEVKSSRNYFVMTKVDDGYVEYDHFKTVVSKTPKNPTYNITGTITDGVCNITADSSLIINITLSGYTHSYAIDDGHVVLDYYEPSSTRINISNKATTLLGFEFAEGTYENSSSTLKDKLDIKSDYMDQTDFDISQFNFTTVYHNEITAQIITLTSTSDAE